jgi:hypothetical protein
MKKPWAIGLISVIPGLGLVVLGETKKGVAAFAITAALFLAFYLGVFVNDNSALATLGFVLFPMAWVLQWIYAVVLAQRHSRQQAGSALAERPVSIAPPPPGASAAQKGLHKATVKVLKLLPEGEQLKLALDGVTGTFPTTADHIDLVNSILNLVGLILRWPGAGLGPPSRISDIRTVYVGLTPHNLVLVKTDALGGPSELKRIPLSQVSLVKAAEGRLADDVILEIGEVKPLHVRIRKAYRGATRGLTRSLSQPALS